jgi:hypothetical protein
MEIGALAVCRAWISPSADFKFNLISGMWAMKDGNDIVVHSSLGTVISSSTTSDEARSKWQSVLDAMHQ